MARRAALALIAAMLAGCASSFPASSRVVTEWDLEPLGAGEVRVHEFQLSDAPGLLLVGYRTGPLSGTHIVLRSPGGLRFDTGSELGSCVVTGPSPGSWALEVVTDPLDGELRGGKLTVRAAPAPAPATHPCHDDLFPGAGRNATLALARNVTGEANATFDQPLDLREMRALAVGNVSGANLTVTWLGPDDTSVEGERVGDPAKGRWSIFARLEPPPTEPWTLVVRGPGK